MRGVMILLAVVALVVSSASATVVTWDVDVTDNGDGSSQYVIKAMTDDMAILSFKGTFYCSGPIAQVQGNPGSGTKQIDKYMDALLANMMDPSYDWTKDSYLGIHWDFIPAPWLETANTYGSELDGAGHVPPADPNAGKGVFVNMVHLVAPTGLDFQTAIDAGDFGYRGILSLWDGVEGNPAVNTDAPFGIPEPATMCLLGIGGIGVLLRRKRR